MNTTFDFIIIGGGPSGLSLAWYLLNENKSVLLIEKNHTLGGCHRVERIKDFFTEHGPRVYLDSFVNFDNLLKEMGSNFDNFFKKSEESSFWSTYISEILLKLSVQENLKLSKI